jgi:hypothetical protein
MVLTSGEDRGLKGYGNEIIRRTIGAEGLSYYGLLSRYGELVMGLMIRSLTELPGITISQAAQSGGGRNIRYYALVVEKVVPPKT